MNSMMVKVQTSDGQEHEFWGIRSFSSRNGNIYLYVAESEGIESELRVVNDAVVIGAFVSDLDYSHTDESAHDVTW